MSRALKIVLVAVGVFWVGGCAENQGAVSIVGSETNDVYLALKRDGQTVPRYDDASRAIEKSPPRSALLIMAERYPQQRTLLDPSFFQRAREKQIRLYVEYPSSFPGLSFAPAQKAVWERAVVAADAFGAALPAGRIVAVHGCSFLPTTPSQRSILAIARVAGYDTAIYGLPANSPPLLFETTDGQCLVATTKLSSFVTSRYAPSEDWRTIWRSILHRLDPAHEHSLQFTPIVRPAYAEYDPLPADIESQTFLRAANFYQHARLLIPPGRAAQIQKLLSSGSEDIMTPSTDEEGDGTLGMQEGYSSGIAPDGTQLQRVPIRADCNAEAAMVLSLTRDDDHAHAIARNLLDYVYSPAMQGRERLDPHHPAFGLIAWGAISRNWQIANYGDDNARTILATLCAAASLKTDRWDVPVLRALLANLRTTGRLGFRGDRIDMPALSQQGWKPFHDASPVNYSPHFESYLWACHLWAYHQTGEREFLEKARNAIEMTMGVYPAQWRLQINLERARMLLCLAWLVRVDDTPTHRAFLASVAHDLIQSQQSCGAIQDRVGETAGGRDQLPQSNSAYGTSETSLIQKNGDPVCDQLYTTGFALLGLHEAFATTGDPTLKQAEDKLAEFLCRIQTRSEKLPYLSGTWFRAFDYKRWECWASSADAGWGAWSIEAGWAQAWTATVLALRRQNTDLWSLTTQSQVQSKLQQVQAEMSLNDGFPMRAPN